MKRLLYLMIAIAFVGCGDDKGKKAGEGDGNTEKEEKEIEAVVLYDRAAVFQDVDSKKWVAALNQGMVVTFLNEEVVDEKNKNRPYLKIRMIDGKEGYTPANLLELNASPRAVVQEVTLYSQPQLSALTDKKFVPLDVIAVLEEKGDWTKVKGKGWADGWYKEGWIKNTDALSDTEKDLAVALHTGRAGKMKDEEKRLAEYKKLYNNADFKGSSFQLRLDSLANPIETEEEADDEYYDIPDED